MANEIYDSTWWGNTIDTASSIGTSTEMIQGQFNLTKLGDELVTNGDFATDSDWVKAPSGVIISGGSANFNSASDTYIYQDILTANKIYKVTFSGTINSGSFYIGENGAASNIYTSGTYTNEVAYFTVSSSARFIIRKIGAGDLNAAIDNVSVKQVRATTVEASKCLADAIHRIGIQDIQN